MIFYLFLQFNILDMPIYINFDLFFKISDYIGSYCENTPCFDSSSLNSTKLEKINRDCSSPTYKLGIAALISQKNELLREINEPQEGTQFTCEWIGKRENTTCTLRLGSTVNILWVRTTNHWKTIGKNHGTLQGEHQSIHSHSPSSSLKKLNFHLLWTPTSRTDGYSSSSYPVLPMEVEAMRTCAQRTRLRHLDWMESISFLRCARVCCTILEILAGVQWVHRWLVGSYFRFIFPFFFIF